MLKKLSIIIGIACIAGAVILTGSFGFTFGNLAAAMIGLTLIFLGIWFRKFPLWLRRTISLGAGLTGIFFIVITSILIIHGNKDTVDFSEDCLLVLGSGIKGEKILPTLESRLDKCLEYLTHNPDIPLVVSGGQGPNESFSEAEAMKRYLVENGIPPCQIIEENESRNTIENISFSKEILDRHFNGKNYTVACITSDYHIFRTKKIAEKAKMNIYIYHAGVKWYLRPTAYLRETLSLCKFWFHS
jgi:uncharacterized SAM-binding protein YcdF (DUF218 family)